MPPSAFGDAKAIAALGAIKDQETAGVDLISDGELFRRDDNRFGPPNAMINYFAAKIPGFSAELRDRSNITPLDPSASLPAPVVTDPLQPAPLGLVEELRFLRRYSSRSVKIAMTGPHMFARIVWDECYGSPEVLAMEMAAIINAELRRLDRAGCDVIQLDEPVLWFRPDDQVWGAKAVNACFQGVKRAKRAIHVCQGNYNPDPTAHRGLRIFPSEFQAILPVIQAAQVDLVLMAFAALKEKDITALKDFPKDKALGVGVIDVQEHRVETPAQVARTIQRVLQYVPPKRLLVCPDCGLNHLPRPVAFGKLQAMVKGAELVRQALSGKRL
ncbi:MAG: hypothetical protein M5R38_04915 [Candidatus Methylomirabilis sp.]|nr:hypothetical protein [Candidatus Methylomirabilis sp.]